MTDVVPVHRRIARDDPIGRFEKPDRPARFPVGFFEKDRRPDIKGGGQGADGTRKDGLFSDQMIICGLTDSRVLQEGVEGYHALAAESPDVLPREPHVRMVLNISTDVKFPILRAPGVRCGG